MTRPARVRNFMTRRLEAAALSVLLFLSLGCRDAASPAAGVRPADATTASAVRQDGATAVRDARVDSIMNAVIRANEPGASVIVIHNGQIVHEAGYGMADLARHTPNTPQSLYHMASSGKQFTSMAIMMFKEQGRLLYRDPISRHLPQLARWGNQVTIAQLMHHISGIPDYYTSNVGYRKLLQLDPTPDNDDALTLFETWGTPQPGGVKYVYSNAGYDLLGTLVERLSGQTFDAYMQQHIFQPLGMTGSFSMPNAARFADPNRARGYNRRGSGWTPDDYDPLDNLVGSGSVYSSVHDLYAYDQALYTNQLVQQSTLQQAFTPFRLNNGTTVQYGFAWYLGTRSGHDYVSHGGSWEGYLSYILRFPADHFSVFVLANRTDISPSGLAFKIFHVFEPSL